MYKEWDGEWKCNKVDEDESTTTLEIADNFVVNLEVGNSEGADF
jgi:hypothetical protein